MGIGISKTSGFDSSGMDFNKLTTAVKRQVDGTAGIDENAELRWKKGKGLYAKNKTWNKTGNKIFGSSILERGGKYLKARDEVARSINRSHQHRIFDGKPIGDYVVEKVITDRIRLEAEGALIAKFFDEKQASENNARRAGRHLKPDAGIDDPAYNIVVPPEDLKKEIEKRKSNIFLRVSDLAAITRELDNITNARSQNPDAEHIESLYDQAEEKLKDQYIIDRWSKLEGNKVARETDRLNIERDGVGRSINYGDARLSLLDKEWEEYKKTNQIGRHEREAEIEKVRARNKRERTRSTHEEVGQAKADQKVAYQYGVTNFEQPKKNDPGKIRRSELLNQYLAAGDDEETARPLLTAYLDYDRHNPDIPRLPDDKEAAETRVLARYLATDIYTQLRKDADRPIDVVGEQVIQEEASERAWRILYRAGLCGRRVNGKSLEYLPGGLDKSNIQLVMDALRVELQKLSDGKGSRAFTRSLFHSAELPGVIKESGGRLLKQGRALERASKALQAPESAAGGKLSKIKSELDSLSRENRQLVRLLRALDFPASLTARTNRLDLAYRLGKNVNRLNAAIGDLNLLCAKDASILSDNNNELTNLYSAAKILGAETIRLADAVAPRSPGAQTLPKKYMPANLRLNSIYETGEWIGYEPTLCSMLGKAVHLPEILFADDKSEQQRISLGAKSYTDKLRKISERSTEYLMDMKSTSVLGSRGDDPREFNEVRAMLHSALRDNERIGNALERRAKIYGEGGNNSVAEQLRVIEEQRDALLYLLYPRVAQSREVPLKGFVSSFSGFEMVKTFGQNFGENTNLGVIFEDDEDASLTSDQANIGVYRIETAANSPEETGISGVVNKSRDDKIREIDAALAELRNAADVNEEYLTKIEDEIDTIDNDALKALVKENKVLLYEIYRGLGNSDIESPEVRGRLRHKYTDNFRKFGLIYKKLIEHKKELENVAAQEAISQGQSGVKQDVEVDASDVLRQTEKELDLVRGMMIATDHTAYSLGKHCDHVAEHDMRQLLPEEVFHPLGRQKFTKQNSMWDQPEDVALMYRGDRRADDLVLVYGYCNPLLQVKTNSQRATGYGTDNEDNRILSMAQLRRLCPAAEDALEQNVRLFSHLTSPQNKGRFMGGSPEDRQAYDDAVGALKADFNELVEIRFDALMTLAADAIDSDAR